MISEWFSIGFQPISIISIIRINSPYPCTNSTGRIDTLVTPRDGEHSTSIWAKKKPVSSSLPVPWISSMKCTSTEFASTRLERYHSGHLVSTSTEPDHWPLLSGSAAHYRRNGGRSGSEQNDAFWPEVEYWLESRDAEFSAYTRRRKTSALATEDSECLEPCRFQPG